MYDYGSPTRLQTGTVLNNCHPDSHLSQHTELVTTSTSSKLTLTSQFRASDFLLKTSLCGFTAFRKGIAQTYTMS